MNSRLIGRSIFLVHFVLLFVYVQIASGQINYSEFNSSQSGDFTFLQDAGVVGNALRLIRVEPLKSASTPAAVWNNTPQRVTDGFVAMFTFRILNGQGSAGADGFAFVIQSAGPSAIATGGGQIGYATNEGEPPFGISNSLAFEFDTFQNANFNDPNDNHLSIHNNGTGPNDANESFSLGSTTSVPPFRDGNAHLVRIEYDGPSNSHELRVFIDNLTAPALVRNIDISSILAGGGPNAWIGFTAGSAGYWETNDILNWSFSPAFPEISYTGTAPDADTGGPFTVTTAEYHPGADANDHHLNAIIDTAVLPDRKTELWAKYYFPNNLSGGPFPIVVLLHGNHGTCGQSGPLPGQRTDKGSRYTLEGQCTSVPERSGNVYPLIAPSHRGYDYLANALTKWGYKVVSVNANLGINSGSGYIAGSIPNFPEYREDPDLILARGRLVLRHLQKLSEWNDGIANFASGADITSAPRVSNTTWIGNRILVGSQPIVVRSLGRMYRGDNIGNRVLRIVRANDNAVLAQTTVLMSDWNYGQFRYSNLTSPVTLAANTTYYIVSQEESGNRFLGGSISASGVATLNGVVASTDGLTWTDQAIDPVFVDFYYEISNSTPSELGINLKHKIDFGNVGLMGHSRGGEGMRAVYDLYRDSSSPWLERVVSPLVVKGIFEIAPTDRRAVNRFGEPWINADDTAWAVLLPACDGDIAAMWGAKHFDRILGFTTESIATPKSTFYVYGANHNFYNTEWQVSDSNGCIGANNTALFSQIESASQRQTGLKPFLAFFRANVGNAATPSLNQIFDPRYAVPTSVSSLTTIERGYSASPSSTRTKVFNDLAGFSSGSDICSSSSVVCNSGVVASTLSALASPVQTNPIRGVFGLDHDDAFFPAAVSWTSASPDKYLQTNYSGGTTFNASGLSMLEFRVSRRRRDTPTLASSTGSDVLLPNSLNGSNFTGFSVQLVMNDGSITKAIAARKFAILEGPVGKPHYAIQDGELHPLLKTIRVPLSEFQASNLSQVRGVRFVFNDSLQGAIFLSHIRFSN